MKKRPSILGILAAYAVLNVVLVWGQGILKRDDAARAESIAGDLDRLGEEIARLEPLLEPNGEEGREADTLDPFGIGAAQRSQNPAAQAAYGAAYGEDLAQLSRQGEGWTAGASESQGASIRYEQLIAEYNALVEEYETVAEAASSRWWLLPIPAPRGAARALRQGE